MKPIATKRRLQDCRQGSVLMIVLVAIIIMSLTTSTFLLLMRNEHTAARYSGNRLQTEMLAQSGVEYLKVLLTLTPSEIEQQGGLIDNPDLLQEVLVIDDPVEGFSGYFTVITSDLVQGYYENTRYGLENESAKLNLNTLLDDEDSSAPSAGQEDSTSQENSNSSESKVTPRDRLLMIPGMNEEVADAILDWLDEDDDARDFGVEAAHYQSLTPAYLPRNGPIAQLDDLLMVQGVSPELLYGLDVNRNFKIDDNELPRGALKELNDTNGEMNRGWSAYLTVYSSEKSVDADGEPKINLNDSSLEDLHQELSSAIGTAEANFLIAYRQYGPTASDTENDSNASPGGSQGGNQGGSGSSSEGEPVSATEITIDFEKEGETQIESMLDLIDARVLIKEEEEGSSGQQGQGQQGQSGQQGQGQQGQQSNPGKLLVSPWTDDSNSYRLKFAELLDVVTTDSGTLVEGRININQASLPVLLTIPGMTEMLADQILASRDPTSSSTGGEQRHPVWLLADGIVTLEEYKPMAKHLTTGGDVFSGQIIGFFDAGTARSRGEVLLDRSGEKTRLLGWRDLSPLGAGFSRSVLSKEPRD